MSIGCVLFDLDGTLTDADHLHFAAFNAVLGRFGRSIDIGFYTAQVMGHSNTAIFGRLFPGADSDHVELADEKERHFRHLAEKLEPATGLLALLDRLAAKNVPQGVVTNAPRANALHELLALGLSDRFQTLVIGEELPNAKPHPLPYLTGLDNLKAEAGRSLAFEDSLSGVQSAIAAGLAVVGMTTSLAPETLVAAGAALAVADYADERLWPLIERRLALSKPEHFSHPKPAT